MTPRRLVMPLLGWFVLLSPVVQATGGEVALGRFDAAGGLTLLAGDVCTSLDFTLTGRFGDAMFAVRAPVRLRLVDLGRRDEGAAVQLRRQDWDTRSEWMRLIDLLSWEDADGTALVRVGAVRGETLGHGTLVQRFVGDLLTDQYRGGMVARADVGWGGFEALTDDVLAWELLAARVFLRPWRARGGGRSRVLRSLTFALSSAVDRRVPLVPILTAEGEAAMTPEGLPRATRGLLGLFALDASIELLRNQAWAVVPYVDLALARMPGARGEGLHAGVAVTAQRRLFVVDLRYELRLLRGAWVPGWIDGMYALERHQIRLDRGSTTTRVGAMAGEGRGLSAAHLLSAALRVGRARVTASYEPSADRGLDRAAMWLSLPIGAWHRFDAFATSRRFDGPSAILGGELAMAASAFVAVAPPVGIYVDVRTGWHDLPGIGGLSRTIDVGAGILMKRGF